MSKFEKIFLVINVILYGVLVVFSYAYVDLNLTLSKNPLVVNFVKAMQQLGYFHRREATLIYLVLIIFSFLLFIFNLWLTHKSKVTLKYLKLSAVISTVILIFAYPFLSSDLFNYLFDAKIILKYHANPYTHRALDFPQDEWLRFMRWIHRYSPYGPLWLGMSLLPAVLGFGKFILNFLAFKIFIGLFHLVNTYLIYRFLKKVNFKIANFGTAFYALNPLLLIEGVANAHNDVILATFLIATAYFWHISRHKLSYIALFLGVLIKYIPILNLPWLIWVKFSKEPRNYEKLVLFNLATMVVFTVVFSTFRITAPFVSGGATQVQFQPWYLFWTIPYVALIPKISLVIFSIAISFGALLRYLPYLYFGDWSQPGTISFMQTVTLAPLVVALLVALSKNFQKKIK